MSGFHDIYVAKNRYGSKPDNHVWFDLNHMKLAPVDPQINDKAWINFLEKFSAENNSLSKFYLNKELDWFNNPTFTSETNYMLIEYFKDLLDTKVIENNHIKLDNIKIINIDYATNTALNQMQVSIEEAHLKTKAQIIISLDDKATMKSLGEYFTLASINDAFNELYK